MICMNAVDSNVLIYSVDGGDSRKGRVAAELIASLKPSETVLLWQVACEIGAVFTRLVRSGTLPPESLIAVGVLRRLYPIVLPTPSVLSEGLRIHSQHQVSYWDAMLIAAAKDAGVTRLFTEDRQSRPSIEGVELVNPFSDA